jgi:hypothetical protein
LFILRVRISYALQWGPPTFDAGNAVGVMSAAFAALVEVIIFSMVLLYWQICCDFFFP